MKQENHNQDDESVLRLFGSSEKEIFKELVYKFLMHSFLKRRKEHFAKWLRQ